MGPENLEPQIHNRLHHHTAENDDENARCKSVQRSFCGGEHKFLNTNVTVGTLKTAKATIGQTEEKETITTKNRYNLDSVKHESVKHLCKTRLDEKLCRKNYFKTIQEHYYHIKECLPLATRKF